MKLTQFTAARQDTGVPLPYARVRVRLAGTQTNAVIRDTSLSPIPNPMTADMNGLARFYAPDGIYDVDVVSADGIYAAPPILSLQITDTSALAEIVRQIQSAQTVGQLAFATWDALSALDVTAEQEGSAARVYADTGSHTDPVAGGTVPNEGVYSLHKTTPAGWRRIASLETVEVVQAAIGVLNQYLYSSPGTGVSFAFTDSYGFARAYIDDSGKLFASGIDVSDDASFSSLEVESLAASEILSGADSDGVLAAWVDGYGMAVAILYSNGRFVTASDGGLLIDPDGLARAATFDVRATPQYENGIHVVVCQGQSKSKGYNSQQAISTSSNGTDYMVSGGIPTVNFGASDLASMTMIDMVEKDYAPNADSGETPMRGACDAIHTMLEAIDGIPIAQQGLSFIGAAIGVSGAGQAFLIDKNSQPWQNSLAWLSRAVALARQAGRLPTASWAIMEHGQTDLLEGNNPTTFANNWLTWRQDFENQAEALTGARAPLLLCTVQTSDHLAYDVHSPAIAIAQATIMDSDPNSVCMGPTYMLRSVDGVHYYPEDSRLCGFRLGLPVFWRRFKGVDWRPLKPTGTKYVAGRAVIVPMHVPVRPMQISTDIVSDPGNYGFQLRRKSDGSLIALSQVTVDGDSVRLVAAADLPSQNPDDYWMDYAWGPTTGTYPSGPTTGARGCLHDDQGQYIKYRTAGGGLVRVDNYCVHFRV